MDLPDLDNQTEFEVEPHPLLTPAGEAVVLVIKATFELNSEKQELKLADKEFGIESFEIGVLKQTELGLKSNTKKLSELRTRLDVAKEQLRTDRKSRLRSPLSTAREACARPLALAVERH